ncbi:hypothetical protein QR97_31615 [Streptomyces sp. PBH53]|nr:hypothetical protein QR97_31615 [Streptomyces sp. PBH53]
MRAQVQLRALRTEDDSADVVWPMRGDRGRDVVPAVCAAFHGAWTQGLGRRDVGLAAALDAGLVDRGWRVSGTVSGLSTASANDDPIYLRDHASPEGHDYDWQIAILRRIGAPEDWMARAFPGKRSSTTTRTIGQGGCGERGRRPRRTGAGTGVGEAVRSQHQAGGAVRGRVTHIGQGSENWRAG